MYVSAHLFCVLPYFSIHFHCLFICFLPSNQPLIMRRSSSTKPFGDSPSINSLLFLTNNLLLLEPLVVLALQIRGTLPHTHISACQYSTHTHTHTHPPTLRPLCVFLWLWLYGLSYSSSGKDFNVSVWIVSSHYSMQSTRSIECVGLITLRLVSHTYFYRKKNLMYSYDKLIHSSKLNVFRWSICYRYFDSSRLSM